MNASIEVGRSRWDGKFLIVIILLCAWFYGSTQSPISFSRGLAYDATYYVELAEQVADGAQLFSRKPFIYRIGFPFLVGKLFPGDLMGGFRWVGLTFGLLTLWVLYSLLARLLANKRVVRALVLLFALYPLGPLRLTHFYPTLPDFSAHFFTLCMLRISLGTRCLQWSSCLGLGVLALVGVFFRESICLVSLSVFAAHGFVLGGGIPGRRGFSVRLAAGRQFSMALLPLALSLVGLYWTHQVVEARGTYSFFDTPFLVVRGLLKNVSIYPLAWMVAYGPLIFLAVAGLAQGGASLLQRNPVLLFYGLGVVIATATVGTHTDRFAFWAFPCVLLMLGWFIEEQLRKGDGARGMLLWYGPILIGQAFSLRLLTPLPDDTCGALTEPGMPEWLIFSSYGEGTNIAQIFASFMAPEGRLVLLVQNLVLCIYFLLVLQASAVGSKPAS